MRPRIIILIIVAITVLYAGLFLVAWNVITNKNTGGAEAATNAQIVSLSSERSSTVSEKKSTLLFPIRGTYWKTSDFGIRKSPFTGQSAIHYGTDYGAPEGAEIQAVKDGIVVTHWPAPNGHYSGHPIGGGVIEILHDDGLSVYWHMSETFVHEGDMIEAGDLIGIIGSTGKTAGKTGIHLHFGYICNSRVMFNGVSNE